MGGTPGTPMALGPLTRDAVDTVGTLYTVHTWENKDRGETMDTWDTKHTANTKLGRPRVKPINCASFITGLTQLREF